MHIRLNELMDEKTLKDGRDPKVNKVTQQEVSDAIGVPQGTLSKWAGNKVDRLDKRIITALCVYFQCGIDDLLVLVNVPEGEAQ